VDLRVHAGVPAVHIARRDLAVAALAIARGDQLEIADRDVAALVCVDRSDAREG
jgi:hypothetical protein